MDNTSPQAFPSTRPSMLSGIRSVEPETRQRAMDLLIRAYWKPVYGYLRLKWRLEREDAGDATQEFFLRAIDGDWLAGFDATRARFRTFLRTCVDGFASKERRDRTRLKRDGSVQMLSLDFSEAESDIGPLVSRAGLDVDEWFHREWVRSVFQHSIEALDDYCRQEGKELQFRLFRRYDIEGMSDDNPGYRELAREFKIAETQVTNYLAWVRREFRRIVLEQLRQLTADDEEFQAEAEALLGVRDP